jgi:ANTH domain
MADEVQTFKALITIHKVLQEGHPITVKEAQQNVNWIESLARGVMGEGLRGTPESLGMTKQELAKLLKRRMDIYKARKNQPPWLRETMSPALAKVGPYTDRDLFLGYGPLIREYVYFTLAKLTFHRHHPEFNGE